MRVLSQFIRGEDKEAPDGDRQHQPFPSGKGGPGCSLGNSRKQGRHRGPLAVSGSWGCSNHHSAAAVV